MNYDKNFSHVYSLGLALQVDKEIQKEFKMFQALTQLKNPVCPATLSCKLEV